jgi:hypothetical protein
MLAAHERIVDLFSGGGGASTERRVAFCRELAAAYERVAKGLRPFEVVT